MKTKLGCVLVLSFLMIVGMGCAQKPVTESGSAEPAVQGGPSPNPSETHVDLGTMNTQAIDVYFADAQVLELEKKSRKLNTRTIPRNITRHLKLYKTIPIWRSYPSGKKSNCSPYSTARAKSLWMFIFRMRPNWEPVASCLLWMH